MKTTDQTIAAQLLEALDFSAEKHRNQRRKDQDASPYINHPIKVAKTLANFGGVDDQVTLIAAILHDTIEDTGTNPDEIERKFGKEIRILVEEVTDNKSLPSAERKRHQIKHAPHISDRAKMIKIADKICNIQDIMENPPSDWSVERKQEYLEWSAEVVEGCRGCNPPLEHYFDEILRQGRQSIQKNY